MTLVLKIPSSSGSRKSLNAPFNMMAALLMRTSTPPPCARAASQRGAIFLFRDVAHDQGAGGADGVGDLLEGLTAPPADRHLRAVPREKMRAAPIPVPPPVTMTDMPAIARMDFLP